MMTSSCLKIKPIQFQDDGNKVILEYTMMNYTRLDMITSTYVVDIEPKTPEDCPERHFSDMDQNEIPELTMRPVAMCRDPFRQGKHKIVLCEPNYADKRNKDIAYSTRPKLIEVLNQVKDHEPWFGFEQEFYITDMNDIPLDWVAFQTSTDMGRKMMIVDHVGFERQMVDLHLRACIYAGLHMYGCVRETHPSGWEFQVGPLPGIQAADQLILARYILTRLAELHNVKISFSNVDCMRETKSRQALQLNFCTKNTRAEGGIKSIYEIIENVSKYPKEATYKYFDISNGEEMKWFLNGELYTPAYHSFRYAIGDKDGPSLRIPTHVSNQGKGYVEERRPVSNANPYDVCRVFIIAALFDHKGKALI